MRVSPRDADAILYAQNDDNDDALAMAGFDPDLLATERRLGLPGPRSCTFKQDWKDTVHCQSHPIARGEAISPKGTARVAHKEWEEVIVPPPKQAPVSLEKFLSVLISCQSGRNLHSRHAELK